jgi:hypothetical protein
MIKTIRTGWCVFTDDCLEQKHSLVPEFYWDYTHDFICLWRYLFSLNSEVFPAKRSSWLDEISKTCSSKTVVASHLHTPKMSQVACLLSYNKLRTKTEFGVTL